MVKKVKLSDYIADFIASKNVDTVFAISGGASLHLIHSINDHPKLNYICTHHEQGAAMAADGYSRVSKKIGVAIATSGPGATNLITGICCSFYDSVPLLLLTGQVSTFRMAGKTGVRQIGFQETPITEITKEITKYSLTLKKPEDIRYELEKAFFIANHGRPGPVLIDIPDNLQRSIIDVDQLRRFDEFTIIKSKNTFPSSSHSINKVIDLVKNSERPVVVAGWGIHLSNTEDEFIKILNKLKIPVALTWGASDLIDSNNELYIGTFGTHGMRHANFAVQNADLIISLGTRLDTKSTGSPITTFARDAKKIMIDIDPTELAKFNTFGLTFDILIEDDLREFFKCFLSKINEEKVKSNFQKWIATIKRWENEFEKINQKDSYKNININPYEFFSSLSKKLSSETMLFIDTGCSIAWAMQTLRCRSGMRVFHDFNNTAMGWALPASIGANFANNSKEKICIVGDGSFMMTMQELATVMHHNIKLKLIIINNQGYSMIKQTQDQWLDSNYVASSEEGGLSFPNYFQISEAFNLKYLELSKSNDTDDVLNKFLNSNDSILLNVNIPQSARVKPQVKFGRPNEDMEPLLPRNVFMENMLIEPLQVSLDD